MQHAQLTSHKSQVIVGLLSVNEKNRGNSTSTIWIETNLVEIHNINPTVEGFNSICPIENSDLGL